MEPARREQVAHERRGEHADRGRGHQDQEQRSGDHVHQLARLPRRLRRQQRRRHGLGRFLLPARPRLLAPERFERRAGRHRGQHGGNEQ